MNEALSEITQASVIQQHDNFNWAKALIQAKIKSSFSSIDSRKFDTNEGKVLDEINCTNGEGRLTSLE